jgi:hypothetical protein
LRIEEPTRERLPRFPRVVFGVVLLPVVEAVVESAPMCSARFAKAAREPVFGAKVASMPSRQRAEPGALGRSAMHPPGEEAYLPPAVTLGLDVPRRWPALELV